MATPKPRRSISGAHQPRQGGRQQDRHEQQAGAEGEAEVGKTAEQRADDHERRAGPGQDHGPDQRLGDLAGAARRRLGLGRGDSRPGLERLEERIEGARTILEAQGGQQALGRDRQPTPAECQLRRPAGAALAGGAAVAARLAAIVQAMRDAAGRAATLQGLALDFWQVLVDACDNTAFQLSFNAMRKTYLKAWDRLTAPLAEEFADLANFQAMARAVAAQDAQAARRAAARHVRIGQLALDGAARTDWMNG